MAFSFPSSPTVGDVSVQNGRSYTYAGSNVWELTTAASSGGSGLTWSSVPASATASGTAGQISYDSSYYYVCVATNTWVRTALSTWSPFTPSSVSGLQLWLDASDASTLYDATSGGSLVAADGAVSRWQDKSSNARHFTQSTSGNRPLRKTAQQNGLTTLLFDGSSDVLDGSDFLDLDTGALTAFVVYKRNAAGVRHEILCKTDTGGSGWILYHNSDDKIIFRSQGSASTSRSTVDVVAASSYCLLSMKTSSGSISSTAMWKNSSSLTMATAQTTSGGLETPANTSGILRIGSQEYAGSFYFPLSANVAEIILYNASLSDTDRSAVESYLMSKWAIS